MADQPPGPINLLIPILRAQAAPALLDVAQALLKDGHGTGHLLGVVRIPFGAAIAETVTVARRYRTLLQSMTRFEGRRKAGLGVQVRVAHNVAQGIREAAYESEASTILIEWPGMGVQRQQLLSQVIEDLVSDPPTDLLLVRPDPAGRDRPLRRGSVLVPVRGGPSARMALQVASALAAGRGVPLTVLHVYPPGDGERRLQEELQFRSLVEQSAGERARVLEVESPDPSRAIAAEASKHAVVVLGAYAELTRSGVVVGSRLAQAVGQLPGTVIVAKSARSAPPIRDRESPPFSITGRRRQLSTVVDTWFAENTFHSREFKAIARLVELKKSQGLTISLGLPTLNEATTIGKIIRVMQRDLMERQPLLDEIVVVDSCSTDETAEIATSLGVSVIEHPSILPELGSFNGKGEALWKSLYQLTGDLVVWCDTDIANIHPQFVYGVVGPLLTDPRIGYVKGFYRRPLKYAGHTQAAGGGRVTELTARPVINLFYPELSGLLQPLSGEYGGRRELLERLPFFTGYGVETGHLIDILENFGLNKIAQVDLGVRIHRNQELFDLSKMAFAIMQVALKRLGDRHRMHLLEEVNQTMKLIQYSNDRFSLEEMEVADGERPPMAAVPQYLARRHLLGAAAPQGYE